MSPGTYESHLVETSIQYTAIFLLTYGSLQAAALLYCRGWLRLIAALPLIVMVPVILAGADPDSHRDGSLYGLVIYVPFLPVMFYLAAILAVGICLTRRATTADSGTTTGPTIHHALVTIFALCVSAGIVLLLLMLIPF